MEKDVSTELPTSNSKIVLGLIGSPRKLGNCEVFTKEISKNLKIEHTLRLIRMPSLNILPCDACYGCIMDRPCPNHDDLDFLLAQIVQADAIVIASPVYFFGAHSIFKRILDRAFLFYNVLKQTYGKPCILLNVYGIEDRLGVAPQTLMSLAAFLGLDIKASLNFEAALPGEILMQENGRSKAKEAAEILFSPKSGKNESGCPYCGCEIVRMEQQAFICTLCHGRFAIESDGKKVKVKDADVFGTLEMMLEHREWLRGMKDRFSENKKALLEAVAGYKNIGEWVKE